MDSQRLQNWRGYDYDKKLRMIYIWIKQDVINLTDFIMLSEELKDNHPY